MKLQTHIISFIKSILLVLVLSVLLVNCHQSPVLNYISVNQIAVNETNQIEIIGVSESSSTKEHIKSPYILKLDKELNLISNHHYKTNTTANNPRLISIPNNEKVLSFYKAESLDLPTEQSHLLFLDQDYKLKRQNSFGKRSRIHEITNSASDLIGLIFSRETQSINIKSLQEKKFSTDFSTSKEPCIPTDLALAPDGQLLFCGIENGFHYSDGYNYNKKNASGFLCQVNTNGQIIKQVEYIHDQHLFFDDIETVDTTNIITGTKQVRGNSMDLLLVAYDQNLEIISEKTIPSKAYQRGIKTVHNKGFLYTLIQSENQESRKMNISLMKSDLSFNTIWTQDYKSENSLDPKDIMVDEDKIYFITDKIASADSTTAKLYVVSTEGKLLKQKEIN